MMAGGGLPTAEGGRARHYGGGITVSVVATCLMAASCGLIFGYDIGVSAVGGNSHGGEVVAYAATAPYFCSEEMMEVSQGNAGSLPNGVPSYSVTITNTCLDCTVRDVHISCGEFASTELVDPSDFRRLSYDDCLVRDGGPMGPGDTVSFEYSNSFIYKMDVATVTCGDK